MQDAQDHDLRVSNPVVDDMTPMKVAATSRLDLLAVLSQEGIFRKDFERFNELISVVPCLCKAEPFDRISCDCRDIGLR